jgi:hypothetical protein
MESGSCKLSIAHMAVAVGLMVGGLCLCLTPWAYYRLGLGLMETDTVTIGLVVAFAGMAWLLVAKAIVCLRRR